MPKRKRLTDAGIAKLRPEDREYTVWDTRVAGLGVRVRPSGSRTFIYRRKTDRGVRKLSFGPAALRKVDEVRRACMEAATADRRNGRRRARDGAAVPGLRRRPLEGGPFRALASLPRRRGSAPS